MHRLSIFIERGMHPQDKILLAGQGDETVRSFIPFSPSKTDFVSQPDSSGPGDLIISFKLLPHPTFTLLPPTTPLAPSNLRTTLSLTLSESLLGFDTRLVLVHLDGRGLSASVPAPGKAGWRVVKNGDEVRIKGEGMIKGGEKGDLIVLIEVAMPSAEWANEVGPEKVSKTLSSIISFADTLLACRSSPSSNRYYRQNEMLVRSRIQKRRTRSLGSISFPYVFPHRNCSTKLIFRFDAATGSFFVDAQCWSASATPGR